ncbi:hypothetical protein G6F65_020993 [Rhizopus arrhizus]|nr:hypothetical protein G6F65_020993 [Rhizopus arrhizus]
MASTPPPSSVPKSASSPVGQPARGALEQRGLGPRRAYRERGPAHRGRHRDATAQLRLPLPGAGDRGVGRVVVGPGQLPRPASGAGAGRPQRHDLRFSEGIQH